MYRNLWNMDRCLEIRDVSKFVGTGLAPVRREQTTSGLYQLDPNEMH